MGTSSTTRSRFGGANVRFPPSLVFLGLIGAGIYLERFVPLALPIALMPRVIAGAVLALAGLAIVVSARVQFIRTGQNPQPWTPSPELLVEGIYRRTRNPMYVGISLFMFGLGVASGNGWIAILPPFALVIVHYTAVRPEEAYLAERFGDSYLRYKAAVRRYL